MEGGLPSTQTVLGMVAAGLTVALVDPAIKHRAMPGVVFRAIEDRDVFTESGVIYRRDDLRRCWPRSSTRFDSLRAGASPKDARRQSQARPLHRPAPRKTP